MKLIGETKILFQPLGFGLIGYSWLTLEMTPEDVAKSKMDGSYFETVATINGREIKLWRLLGRRSWLGTLFPVMPKEALVWGWTLADAMRKRAEVHGGVTELMREAKLRRFGVRETRRVQA